MSEVEKISCPKWKRYHVRSGKDIMSEVEKISCSKWKRYHVRSGKDIMSEVEKISCPKWKRYHVRNGKDIMSEMEKISCPKWKRYHVRNGKGVFYSISADEARDSISIMYINNVVRCVNSAELYRRFHVHICLVNCMFGICNVLCIGHILGLDAGCKCNPFISPSEMRKLIKY